MAGKKRGLGRGLDALLGDIKNEPASEKLDTLPIEFLQRGKHQPRREMNSERLQELADSISAQGVVQPVIVRPVEKDRYEIIAGERRWRAAQMAGLHDIPIVIRDVNDQAAMAMGLIENIQREDLNPLEESNAYRRLKDEFGMTHQQIADAVGKSRVTITNLLRLLDLRGEVKDLLVKGHLEMGHARALLGLEGGTQVTIANKIASGGLTVRAAEKLVKDQQTEKNVSKTKLIDPDILRLQDELSVKLGAKVMLNHQNSGKGKLVISYTSLEELEGVMSRIN
ncbi:MAG: ParB/RepB/Spo0J family partition protein [Methylococcales bacterium]